jgi:hypothetical protein
VLPAGLVRLQHYGLLASRCRRETLVRCRELLGMIVAPVDLAPASPEPIMPPVHEAAVTPTRVCPRCGAGRMVAVAESPPDEPSRGDRSGRRTVSEPGQFIIT